MNTLYVPNYLLYQGFMFGLSGERMTARLRKKTFSAMLAQVSGHCLTILCIYIYASRRSPIIKNMSVKSPIIGG